MEMEGINWSYISTWKWKVSMIFKTILEFIDLDSRLIIKPNTNTLLSKGKEAGEGMKGGCLMQGGDVSARRKWAQKVAHRHGR